MTPTSSPRAALDDVAVLMPVYNGGDDVARTLASFREDARVHVLIVDDGSTPPIVAPTLPGLVVEVLRMPRNVGIERALAAGIDALAARGFRYAARIDAGDLAAPGRLARQFAYLEANPRVAGLGMWTQVVSRDGRPLFMLTPPAEPAALRRTRFFRSPFVHPSMMLRIDAVRAVGNYRAHYRAAEDLDLFLRLMARYDCANLPELGLYYELNEGGISATKRRRQVGSTLALLLRHFNPLNPYDWAGLAKNLLHFVTPYRMLQRIKRALFGANRSA
ncbi:glycosyltransferase [Burkholderia sp. FERM BP-3421]|jgi:glycosyltransferase involved in cell wall biosynthesis|uniref:glycosyltransferase n=1 Tax=Burkholderia sp. FERM BP-3421 TaxID=1494466 RepID=UPI002361D460|nr:glycosyltransferase [Burkholderia sp. FERM BP-3421]WDD93204.1 glycosyltransferase [Burkholderia sp. FERM BP-3421]